MEAINNNRIGVCKWVESGTTIDTALPELGDMTNDKDQWKAVIVCMEDDLPMSRFESEAKNPFDFLVNSQLDEEIRESEVPLIRLTQMLGGVPAPEKKFVCEQIRQEGMAPRTVYRPEDDSAQQKAYRNLCRKYEYNGKLPSSVMVIALREGYMAQENIDDAWVSHKESHSSEFWKRNHYPSLCRFLVYDFKKQGPIQRNKDEFGFWLTVLLLATNDIDAATMQGYRLYRVNTLVDDQELEETFQRMSNRLRMARRSIEKAIQRELEATLSAESELPKYRLEIPVAVKPPKKLNCAISAKGFGLLSQGAAHDIGSWNQQKQNAEDVLAEAIRQAERSLDQAAEKMRPHSTFTEDEVFYLDKYQREDMERETEELYEKIVQIQGILPRGDVSDNPGMERAAEQVKQFLRGRVMGGAVLATLAIVLGLSLIAQVPAIIALIRDGIGSIWRILAISGVSVLVTALFGLVALLLQQTQLRGLLGQYNAYLRAAFVRLVSNASDYSTYLSNIASHSRGKSYLNLSRRRQVQVDSTHESKYKHIRAINILLTKLRTWTDAFHLDVDFETVLVDEHANVDTETNPSKNTLYTFETGRSYPVEVNKSGSTIQSPFGFAEKLEIVREELYDDEYS